MSEVSGPATRFLEKAAPWAPIILLALGAAIVFLLQRREFGLTLGTAAWAGAAGVACLAATRAPGRALTALVFALPILPYLRYDTWLGQALPGVLAAAVLIGTAVSPQVAWSRILRDHRRAIAVGVLAFSAMLGVSLVMVLLQRSSFLLEALGRAETGGFFLHGWAELRPQNTFPIDRAGGFLFGPVAGLAIYSLLTNSTPNQADPALRRRPLVLALLLSSAVNLLVACGQAYLPGFPLASLFHSPAGLFYNPVGLAELMTLVAPVALALAVSGSDQPWARLLAIGTLVGIALTFVPIGQRSAHLGVTAGVLAFLAVTWFLLVRHGKPAHRRVAIVAASAVLLLTLGLGGAFVRTSQWQEIGAAIADSPTSTAWLGIGLRAETNRQAFFMVNDRPLGGYGIGGFEAALPAYYDRHGPTRRRWGHALLNHPLHMVVDFGVLGLAASIWLFVGFFGPGIRTALVWLRRPSDMDLLTLGCLAGVGALLLLSVWTGEWLYDPAISIPAFMLLAVTAAGESAEDRRRPRGPVWLIVALPVTQAMLFALGR